MPVVILGPVVHWRSALAAILRQMEIATIETDDVFEGVSAIRSVATAIAVLHSEMPPDELAVFLKATARHGGDVTVALAGTTHDLDPRWSELIARRFENPWLFMDIAAWVASREPGRVASPIADAEPHPLPAAGATRALPDLSAPVEWTVVPKGPLDREALVRLRRLARHEDYFTLLSLPRHATTETVQDVAAGWLRLLQPEALSTDILDSLLDAVKEVRGAIRDAGMVLSDPRSRDLYVAHARSTSLQVSGEPSTGSVETG
jgi:hypothetical protein